MKRCILKRMAFFACMFMLGVMLFKPTTAQAITPKVVNITRDGITKYDITGDGVPDKIQAYSEWSEDDGCGGELEGLVLVNGEVVYSFLMDEEYNHFRAKLIVLENGKAFVFLEEDIIEDSGKNRIYRYSVSGQCLKQIIDLDQAIGGKDFTEYRTISALKVDGNTLKVYYDCVNWTIGDCRLKFTYVSSGKTLKKSPSAGWIKYIRQRKSGKAYKSSTLVVKKKLYAYKSATSSTKCMTLAAGSKITADRIYYSSTYGMRIRVKYNKKYGWVKLSKNPENGYFKYINYLPY